MLYWCYVVLDGVLRGVDVLWGCSYINMVCRRKRQEKRDSQA